MGESFEKPVEMEEEKQDVDDLSLKEKEYSEQLEESGYYAEEYVDEMNEKIQELNTKLDGLIDVDVSWDDGGEYGMREAKGDKIVQDFKEVLNEKITNFLEKDDYNSEQLEKELSKISEKLANVAKKNKETTLVRLAGGSKIEQTGMNYRSTDRRNPFK